MKKTAALGIFMWVVNFVWAQSSPELVLSNSLVKSVKEGQLQIVPNPLVSGTYFWVKVPDREALKGVEVMDSTGERVNKTDITFSKMGLYLPKLKAGTYHLKIHFEEEVMYKKVRIE